MNANRQAEPIPAYVEELAKQVVDASFKVHSALEPGLLESVYEACLCHELKKRGIEVASQICLPISYEGLNLDGGLRLDLLVGNELIVEIKALEKLLPIHQAQLLTYLKLSHKRLGLLINFNVEMFRDGIKRLAL